MTVNSVKNLTLKTYHAKSEEGVETHMWRVILCSSKGQEGTPEIPIHKRTFQRGGNQPALALLCLANKETILNESIK